MSQSSSKTVSFESGVLEESVNVPIFAYIQPIDENAEAALEATVVTASDHTRRFLHSNIIRGESTGDAHLPIEDSEFQIVKVFRLSLKLPPHDMNEGWTMGTGEGYPGIDIQLAPSADHAADRHGIAGYHARLFIHPSIPRLAIEPRHRVLVGSNGGRVLPLRQPYILRDDELINIGNYQYSFTITDYFRNPLFESDLRGFQKSRIHPLLTPASISEIVDLGNGYLCSPKAFAGGTFGKVVAGWTKSGDVVAIKHLNRPSENKLVQHKKIMEHIGAHKNIVRLLDCYQSFKPGLESAYCVYSPLAMMTLASLWSFHYEIDVAAKYTLAHEFLTGLAYLHEEKGIMHRDIKPVNLAVLSFDPPRGIILDLDDATIKETSIDDMKGTLTYLAPEIVSIKKRKDKGVLQEPPAYNRSVDVWALGISLLELCLESSLNWRKYKAPASDPKYVSMVDQEAFEKLSQAIMDALSADGSHAPLFGVVITMLNYDCLERPSATDIMLQVTELRAELRTGGAISVGTIASPRGLKRGFAE